MDDVMHGTVQPTDGDVTKVSVVLKVKQFLGSNGIRICVCKD